MKKKIIAIMVACVALTGCAVQGASGSDIETDKSYRSGNYRVEVVEMPDGTTVDCVSILRAISCDWERRS